MRAPCRALTAILALLAGAARAGCVMSHVATLPITLWQDKLIVPATIGDAPENFILDTGAGTSTLAQSVASALEIPRDFDHTADTFGIGGIENHLYIGEVASLSLGSVALHGLAMPIAAFSQTLADGQTPVAGLIGADILSRFDVDIDLEHRQLNLWRVSGCDTVTPDWPDEAVASPITIEPSHHVSVPARLERVPVDLLLDTGSPMLLVSTGTAARAGATADVLEQGRSLQEMGVNNRPTRAWLHIFTRLEAGGRIFGNVQAAVVQNGRFTHYDGLLGLDFFKRTRVWISYSTATLFTGRQGTDPGD